MKSHIQVFATKLPKDLVAQIADLCNKLGIRKNFLVEEALRDKIEDLLDAYDLRQSMKEATGFHPWESVKKGIR
ncbi:MAG: hypothetical protein HY746_06920 [Elusimicrobia bacterium]|nr:hypothetical protein [Elusimicrobiota bacterium]